MAFERAANDPTAAPTEMMPRFAFRNERNDSDAISTAAISCVTHGSGGNRDNNVCTKNPISKEADMSIQRSLIAFAAVFAASTSAGYAGPCSQDIARLQAAMDAKVRAAATAGPVAPEGTAATMHRQPTPRSMATAESELGGLSPDQVKAARAAMARARAADSANDESACKQAIADAEGVLGQ